ncbi:hypothetical protein ACFV3R_02390 [Streptomyces sp. NPDC059740]|uniref:hypothetical protein n=1 Tax=Streptomyces sp. NPDC059740 TaxID=3346926 RepID=UPI00364A2F65
MSVPTRFGAAAPPLDAAPGGGQGRRRPRRPRLPGPAAVRRARALCGGFLLLAATLLLPFAVTTVWARTELTHTDRYVTAVSPLAHDRDVRDEIVTGTTDGLMAHVHLDGLLRVVPPAQRPAVRARFTAGIREFVDRQVRAAVTSNRFPAIWRQGHRSAHASLIRSLSDTSGRPAAPVTFDLGPVLRQVRTQIAHDGLGAGLTRQIPEINAVVTVLPARDVARARTAYQELCTAGSTLPLATAGCLLLGLLVSPRRNRALSLTALGGASATALLVAALAYVRVRLLAALPDPAARPAAAAFWDALTGSLRTTLWLTVVLGVGTALALRLTSRDGGRFLRQWWRLPGEPPRHPRR